MVYLFRLPSGSLQFVVGCCASICADNDSEAGHHHNQRQSCHQSKGGGIPKVNQALCRFSKSSYVGILLCCLGFLLVLNAEAVSDGHSVVLAQFLNSD